MMRTLNNKRIVGMIFGMFIILAWVSYSDAQTNPEKQSPPAAPSTETTEIADAVPLEATVTSVTGSHVQYSVDGGTTWQTAQKDVKLAQNAMVRTGFSSTCQISFDGNTVIVIDDLSSVRIADFIGNETQQRVRANLQYGAVRCGVEKGRVQSDTQIRTPVAALAIRGTITQVEHDRGTGLSHFAVTKDGPADVTGRGGHYRLKEGMKTDSKLSQHLQTAQFKRFVSVTGNMKVGDFSFEEAKSLIQAGGASDLRIDDPKTIGLLDELRDRIDDIINGDECPGGECDPGPSQ